MEHLAFIYYLISFTTGCISIGISLLIYRQFRKQVIGFYVLFLSALALIMASLTVYLYGRVSGLEGSRSLVSLAEVLDKAGILLFVFSAPFFFNRLVGREITPVMRVLFLVPGSGLVLMILLNAVASGSAALFVIPFLLLHGTTAYCLIIVAASFPRIGNRTLLQANRSG